MAKTIIMPKFEMSQEKGVIVEWLKSDGDVVKRGEPILTVETDKVTMDVESPASGILAGLRGEPGDSIPVTETIGYVLKEGESIPSETTAPKVAVASTPASTPASAPAATSAPAPKKSTNAGGKPGKKIIMPKFEMSQEFGVVVEWLKAEGDEVNRGEPILTVETDKVTMDVESPAKGKLAALRGEPGDKIPVTETIGWVLKEGEVVPEDDGSLVVAHQESADEVSTPVAASGDVKASPVARNVAAAEHVALTGVNGSGRDGKIMKQDVLKAAAGLVSSNGKVASTPAAKRIANENNVNLFEVAGTGPSGRIQAQDVVDYIEASKIAPETAVASASTVGAVAPVLASGSVPYVKMRKRIGDNLQGSWQTAPHVFMKMKLEMDAFEDLRDLMNEKAAKAGTAKVSATALLTKMVAAALKLNPMLNSTLHEDQGEIELKNNVNVGVAVALDDGLIVPVVKNADLKGVTAISAEIKELATRAKAGKATLEDIGGGTFTISNLGPFGVAEFTSIINPGQSAILAVGATEKEVRFDEETDEIYNVPVLTVTLSIDHRVVDGAVGAKFLTDLKEIVETPGMLFW
jgi:pyruvate dehydrogenase E2 component (dihydrolipoamide acetyltransferase)